LKNVEEELNEIDVDHEGSNCVLIKIKLGHDHSGVEYDVYGEDNYSKSTNDIVHCFGWEDDEPYD